MTHYIHCDKLWFFLHNVPALTLNTKQLETNCLFKYLRQVFIKCPERFE